MNNEHEKIKDLFMPFMEKNQMQAEMEKKHFVYCLVRVIGYDFEEIEYQKNISEIIRTADESDADVNQFLGGVLLILFGLPIAFGDPVKKAEDFLKKINLEKSPVQVFIGEDSGPTGIFGYEKRYIATALSKNIEEDLKTILQIQEKGIYTRKSISSKITGIDAIVV